MKPFFFLYLLIPLCCWGQFKITGTLTDKGGTPVSDCVVKLLQEGKVVRAAFSQEDGSFVIEKLTAGEYTLIVHSVFYELFSYKFSLQTDLSLGTFSLTEKVQELSETTIASYKKPITHTDTGVLIDVAESKLKNRDNIMDILDYAPSVSTINGLTILGSDDIQIFLDDKQLHLPKDKIEQFLNTLPIQLIQSIEVVDRMDASADASQIGMIKINTIQKQGWVGEVKQKIYYNSRWGYGNDIDLFYGTDKYRIYGNIYHSRHKTLLQEASEMTLSKRQLSFNSNTQATLKRREDNILLGADYTPQEKTKWSFLYIFHYDMDKDHHRETQTEVFDHQAYDYRITSDKLFSQTSKDHSFSVALNHALDTLGSNLQLNLDFMDRRYINPSKEQETFHKASVTTKTFEEEHKDHVLVYACKAAWNKKFANKQKFSLGTRFSLVDNSLYQDKYDIISQQYIRDEAYSKDFFLKEYILAFYTTYSYPIAEHSSIAVGARGEYNYNDFNNKVDYYHNKDMQWLFNALYTTQLWEHNFYISAAQRLQRPYFNAFNPTYIRYSVTSAGVGNKELKPANSYQFQLGHTGKLNLNLTYRYTKNNIVYVPSDANGVQFKRPENGGYKNDLYIHASSNQKINDWWEIYAKVVGGNLDFRCFDEKFHSLYAEISLSQRFYLPLNIELGMDYAYTSDYKYMYFKKYQNNTFGISLFYPISESFKLNAFVSDIFNTSRSKQLYNFNEVYNYSYDKANTRFFGISLTYEFAKGKEVNEDIRQSDIEAEKNRL